MPFGISVKYTGKDCSKVYVLESLVLNQKVNDTKTNKKKTRKRPWEGSFLIKESNPTLLFVISLNYSNLFLITNRINDILAYTYIRKPSIVKKIL